MGRKARKLLKSIALGGGAIAVGKTLPQSWTRPVVESVMLPAHAQASVINFYGVMEDFLNQDEEGEFLMMYRFASSRMEVDSLFRH